jgi:uncharacterized SAM-binding protein YcdF (DUF218 family)
MLSRFWIYGFVLLSLVNLYFIFYSRDFLEFLLRIGFFWAFINLYISVIILIADKFLMKYEIKVYKEMYPLLLFNWILLGVDIYKAKDSSGKWFYILILKNNDEINPSLSIRIFKNLYFLK